MDAQHTDTRFGDACVGLTSTHTFSTHFFSTQTLSNGTERKVDELKACKCYSHHHHHDNHHHQHFFYFCLQCWGFWGCKIAQKLFMREKLKSWINRLKNHEGGEKRSFEKFAAVAMIIKVQYLERKNQWKLAIDAKLIWDFVVKMLFWEFLCGSGLWMEMLSCFYDIEIWIYFK